MTICTCRFGFYRAIHMHTDSEANFPQSYTFVCFFLSWLYVLLIVASVSSPILTAVYKVCPLQLLTILKILKTVNGGQTEYQLLEMYRWISVVRTTFTHLFSESLVSYILFLSVFDFNRHVGSFARMCRCRSNPHPTKAARAQFYLPKTNCHRVLRHSHKLRVC